MDLQNLVSKLEGEKNDFSSFSKVDEELTLDTFSQLQYDRPDVVESEFPGNNGETSKFISEEFFYIITNAGDMIEVGQNQQFKTIADAKITYEDISAIVVKKTEKVEGESEVESHLYLTIYKGE